MLRDFSQIQYQCNVFAELTFLSFANTTADKAGSNSSFSGLISMGDWYLPFLHNSQSGFKPHHCGPETIFVLDLGFNGSIASIEVERAGFQLSITSFFVVSCS